MTKKSKSAAPVHSGQSVTQAFKSILIHNLDLQSQWEVAARSWEDIEGVHQMRVAFRRMRSALGLFRSAVPHTETDQWSEEMRGLAAQLGPARDLDVFIDEGLGAIEGKLTLPGGDKLMALAEHRREAAYQTVQAMLDGDRYGNFRGEFRQWTEDQAWLASLSDKRRKAVHGNVVSFARKVLDKCERRVLSAGSHVDQDSAQEMHELRIKCKKLRYAADFFSPLFRGVDDFIGHMKGLQDLLGVMNDVAVMPSLLHELLTDHQDSQVLQYAGGLVGWRTRQYYEIKSSFDTRWDEFVSAKHPWWKKSAVIR